MDRTLALLVFVAVVATFIIIIWSASEVIDDLRKENKQLKNKLAYLEQFRKR